MKGKKIRAVIAKCGRDGHTRGITLIAQALRDAGMEVILLGLHRTVEDVVEAAIQEGVDVLGISQLDGTHMAVFKRAVELLKEKGAKEQILLVGGGVIPEDEMEELERFGVDKLFEPGASLSEIVEFIRNNVKQETV